MLEDYEAAMKQMVSDSQKMKDEDRLQIESLNKNKSAIELELKAVEAAFRELKGKFNDMKIINEGLRKVK